MVDITVKSTHSQKRSRDFFKFHLFKISPIRYVYYGIALALFVISMVFFLMKEIGSSLFFLFVSAMVLVIRVATTNIMLNKIMKNIYFPAMNYKLTFNEEGITYSYDMHMEVFKWENLLYVYDVDNYIFFYVKRNGALILSKYNIKDEERKKILDIVFNSKVKYRIKKYKG